jgi:hypothetical protein
MRGVKHWAIPSHALEMLLMDLIGLYRLEFRFKDKAAGPLNALVVGVSVDRPVQNLTKKELGYSP